MTQDKTNKTVWKWRLRIDDTQVLNMPKGAKVLWVAMQDGRACLWAEVDEYAPVEKRRIEIRGTGHPLPAPIDYLGSVIQGPFVWHIYEMPIVHP